jgi:CMP-N-acetylneuraminic acid synthetase
MNPTTPSISVILPMRAGSKRVPKKNMRPFASARFGLAEIKLRHLLKFPYFDEIIVDTDEPLISELLSLLEDEGLATERIRVEPRDPLLAHDLASTDDLIRYAGAKSNSTHTLWTHVTSPLAGSDVYIDAIKKYHDSCLESRWDSLMSVTPLQEFIWDENGPVNYDPAVERWPRTQTLPDWFFINSAIFIAPTTLLRDEGRRVGDKPLLFRMDKVSSLDIDGLDDFSMAQAVYQAVMQGTMSSN